MEKEKRRYARLQGFKEWEDFKTSIETEEEYNIHENIVMFTKYKSSRNKIPFNKKNGRALYTGDKLSCLRVARLLVLHDEFMLKKL